MLEVDRGVYLTSYNLDKNGITQKEIEKFQNKIKKYGKHQLFFSINEIKRDFPKEIIVDFCVLDDSQLAQFIDPIMGVEKLSFDSGDSLYYCGSTKGKGALLNHIMGNKESMTIYEIEDVAEDEFGVKYLETDICNDVRFTKFYYSEEMGKIYANKKAYFREVYLKWVKLKLLSTKPN